MNKIDSIKIGNFIKALRCGLKLSQDDLAKKLCEQYLQTSAKAVSDWEKGRHYLILIKFLRYAKF